MREDAVGPVGVGHEDRLAVDARLVRGGDADRGEGGETAESEELRLHVDGFEPACPSVKKERIRHKKRPRKKRA